MSDMLGEPRAHSPRYLSVSVCECLHLCVCFFSAAVFCFSFFFFFGLVKYKPVQCLDQRDGPGSSERCWQLKPRGHAGVTSRENNSN